MAPRTPKIPVTREDVLTVLTGSRYQKRPMSRGDVTYRLAVLKASEGTSSVEATERMISASQVVKLLDEMVADGTLHRARGIEWGRIVNLYHTAEYYREAVRKREERDRAKRETAIQVRATEQATADLVAAYHDEFMNLFEAKITRLRTEGLEGS